MFKHLFLERESRGQDLLDVASLHIQRFIERDVFGLYSRPMKSTMLSNT